MGIVEFSTKESLERINRVKILMALRLHEALSKRELCALCDLSRPTVDKAIEAFLQKGLVQKDGYRESSGGRRSTLYQFNTQAKYAIGIDLEIPALSLMLSDLNGHPVRTQRLTIPLNLDKPEPVIEFIADQVMDLIEQAGLTPAEVVGIGFGVPAFTAGDTITIRGRNLPDWRNVPVKSLLEKRLKLPVFVDNDTNFMALAECHRRDSNDEVLAYLALRRGTGGDIRMGGSVMMYDKLFRGAHGNAVCLQGAYVELDAALRAFSKSNELVTTLRDGLITPILHLIMLFDPTRVVINAGVLGEYEELFISQCEAALRERITGVFEWWDFCVEAAREKELACAKGAAFAVLQDLFSKPDLIERLTARAIGGEVVISAARKEGET